MQVRFSELRDMQVDEANAGSGRLADLYFDDRTWRVTDVIVETGHWPKSHRVLVEAADVRIDRADGDDGVHVRIDDGAVQRDADAELPVSRQMELKYHDYLRWLAYWINGFAVPYAPDAMSEMPAGDSHLRSAAAVLGHHILARDGDAGHVADYIIDPADWYIRDLVVHAGVWPHAREAHLSPYWVSDVSWPRSCIDVRIGRERVLRGTAEAAG
jgi:hypothetical protein